MNLQETGQLIGRISVYHDNFAHGLTNEQKAQKATAWHELLSDYTYADCLEAVKDYFATETEPWIMPSHIIHRVEETQMKRLDKFGGFIPLNPQDEFDHDENIAPDYKQKISHLHSLAKHGHITPGQYDAYRQDRLTLTQLTNQPKEITQ